MLSEAHSDDVRKYITKKPPRYHTVSAPFKYCIAIVLLCYYLPMKNIVEKAHASSIASKIQVGSRPTLPLPTTSQMCSAPVPKDMDAHRHTC